MAGRAGGQAAYTSAPGYIHDALLYDSTDELAAIAAPFLMEGLAAGDAAVIAAGDRTAALLTDAVDADPRVHVLARSDVYRSRIPTAIVTFRRLAEQRSPGGTGRVRVVGEVDFGRTERDWLEWQRYDAAINHALATRPLWGLCVFDTQRQPEQVLESAIRTHPNLVTPQGRGLNPLFGDPARYLRSLPVPPEPLEDTPPRLRAADVSDSIALRRRVAAELATVDAPRQLLEDFLRAAHEMASDALRHGQAPVTLRLWISPDRLVCTVSDLGPGWDDPFAGYGPAHGDVFRGGGTGLWLARQLCDHVDISRDDGGVTVRLTTDLR
jgi:anti-sigma regulatory factor (Ser/Thr protein kinase)